MFRPAARLLPPFAVVEHRGRVSGRVYRTPVFAFRRGDRIIIVLSYGTGSDWVRNLLRAGGGALLRLGRRWSLADPAVIRTVDSGPMSPLGRFSRRFADHVFTARMIRAEKHSSRTL